MTIKKTKTSLQKALAICSIVMGMGLFSGIAALPVHAAESVTKTETFTLEEADDFTIASYTGEDHEVTFEKEITENGNRYTLGTISYEVTKQEKITEKKTVKLEKKQSGLSSKDATFDDVIQQVTDGSDSQEVAFKLQSVVYKNKSGEGRATNSITRTLTSDLSVSRPHFPATKSFTYYDAETDQDVSVTLNLQSVIPNGDAAWVTVDPLTVTYQKYDSAYYLYGTQIVTRNDQIPELTGLEDRLLMDCGYDTDNYRITGYRWAGDTYNQNGVLYRKAYALTQGHMQSYTATYTGDNLRLPKVQVYDAVATYSAKVDMPTGKSIYTIKATASYDKANSFFTAPVIITGSIALLIIIGLVILILYLIAKRREDKKKKRKLTSI